MVKNPNPPKNNQFTVGDPRSARGGRASKGVPKRTAAQKEADARMAFLLERVPKLPQGADVPSAMEVQDMARAFAPAALHFASDVLSDSASALTDKFNAANLLLRHGAMVGAAEHEELTRLKKLLAELRAEHQESVSEMTEEAAKLRKENEALAEQLKEARGKIRTTPAEEIQLPKVANG